MFGNYARTTCHVSLIVIYAGAYCHNYWQWEHEDSVTCSLGGAASVVSRFSRAPQIHLPNLPTEMENIITDDQNWYSKQPSQH